LTSPRKWFLTIGLATVPLLGFWLYGLFDLDEGFYAAVVAEMNRRGEWITPYYHGKPWFEKPILTYWLAKPSVLAFGEAVGPRLPSVLCAVALYCLCAIFIRKRVSSQAAQWSVLILSTSLLFVGLSRMLMTDVPLTLAVTGAFLTFYQSLVGNRNWRLATAFFLGVSVLAKGPVALPLFVVLAIWTYASEKELRPSFKGLWLYGTLILAGTVGLWYLPAYIVNGQVFIQKFLVEQNLQRFGGGDEAHKVPLFLWPFYYPVVLFVGMFPWSIGLVKPWSSSLKKDSTPLQRYLGRWAFIVLIFFTISGTKLPHYILPAIPPLAMLAGISWAERRPFSLKLAAASAIALCVAMNAALLLWYKRSGGQEVHGLAREVNARAPVNTLVISYELARQANSKSKLSMNETDSPSLGFYLDLKKVDWQESGSFRTLEGQMKQRSGQVSYILTRPSRLSEGELKTLQKAGYQLNRVGGEEQYVLYEAVPKG
jgi:4-amino-4-deoxy-L-arabinose transferase-like glycosyltransferase